MIVYVYRSLKREDLYLYLNKKDDFSGVPSELMTIFGKPIFSLVFDLNKKTKLARVDINAVRSSINELGYYLQLPPKPENLLGHKVSF
ncbi:YcgL domain-containing protein [Thorsellia anophelis]|uniref:YcgL domain-containing protein SAMN02583745_02404 n=1 Tax=Thorsellia anophelis DSM 18579 TaxID=1123402 RepID=A0A1I0EI88_9GAMM|nr:YcgL domain-containing protein [Thorsellia anophelis]SET45092.1 hypothetical protein SAMN02583745_02404 [Thorsellia anophelis DSM 18579]